MVFTLNLGSQITLNGPVELEVYSRDSHSVVAKVSAPYGQDLHLDGLGDRYLITVHCPRFHEDEEN